MPITRGNRKNKKKVTFVKAITAKKKKATSKKKVTKDKESKKQGKEHEDAESLLKILLSKNTVLDNREMSTKNALKFTGNTTGYDSAKDKSLLTFWWTLGKNSQLSHLAEIGSSGMHRFFEITADKRSKSVKSVINIVMVNWVQKLVKKKYREMDIEKMSKEEYAAAQYEPNCLHLFDSMIFSSLRINVSQ